MGQDITCRIELLDPARHRRDAFDCGVPVLNEYLRKRANQEAKASATACYVLVPESDPSRVAGFYTLSAASVELAKVPEALRKKLPRYPELGAILIRRLGCDREFQGRGVGTKLLADALRRSLQHSGAVGAVAVVVDAKDESAAAFHKNHGFRPMEARRWFVSMAELKQWQRQGWKR